MEGRVLRVVASGERAAELVGQHVVVAHAPDFEKIHALRHVLVLAEIRWRFALAAPARPLGDRAVREDLQRPVDHVPLWAIDDEHSLGDEVAKVPPQPLREEDAVGVRLNGERVVLPLALVDHPAPRVDEELRVARGVVDRVHDRGAAELQRAPAADGRLPVGGQDGVPVAVEDASPSLVLRIHEAHLVPLEPDDSEAKHRRKAFDREAVAPGPELPATPRVVAIRGVLATHTLLAALGVELVLLVALHVHA
mmetsp:Transcript_67456/g.206592  ORF Transcript_67456/g.206592 Transcript_67456/m.206592 type:complete len:252 (+) Transcript_67456:199-954(+)